MHGSWRGKAREKTEPPAEGEPEVQDWINAEAKQVWEQVAAQLIENGVAARIDANALNRYCQTFARWKAAEQFIQKYGETYPLKDKEGNVRCFQQHPQVSIANKLSLMLCKMEAEFGMTPASRSNITVSQTKDPDDPLDILKRIG